jgi:ParB family transcriptional regulator, chromosome partitioning protein
MQSIASVDPFRCRMWDLHDRLEHHIDEVTCKAEIESFLKHGQLIPALGRTLRGDPLHDVELFYGSRRLFVARHLNRPLLVELRDFDDVQGIIAMHIENRHRLDISPYERGLSYLRWMRSGYFKSQDEIAHALKVSPSQVSRLLKLAKFPSVVIAAFPSPMDICETWALDLATALDDPERRKRICDRARVIATMQTRPSARAIYRQLLMAPLPGPKVKTPRHDEVVCGNNGKPLFRIRHQSNAVSLLIPISKVSAVSLTRLCTAVSQVLQQEISQRTD